MRDRAVDQVPLGLDIGPELVVFGHAREVAADVLAQVAALHRSDHPGRHRVVTHAPRAHAVAADRIELGIAPSLLVLLGNEAEAEQFREALVADPVRLVSAATVLEATLVVESRWGDAGGRELDHLLVKADVESCRSTSVS